MKQPLSRYARQTILPEIGPDGQARLKKSRIVCVGAGGLGSPAVLYLAAAGVGTIGLVDFDRVDVTNLQRQILFQSTEAGELKVDASKRRLEALNPEVCIEPIPHRLTAGNAMDILSRYEIIIDGTDNFAAKYLINDAAVKLGLPVVYGSLLRFEGQVSVFWAKYGPCYRCLYPAPPKTLVMNCAEAGVLGAVAGVIGSMQAAEAIKLAIQGANPGGLVTLCGSLLVLDCSTMAPFVVQVPKIETCPVCSRPPEQVELVDLEAACLEGLKELTAADLAQAISAAGERSPLLIDVREHSEWQDKHIPGAVNVPLSRLRESSDIAIEFRSAQNIIVYCQSGVRSRIAAHLLQQKGIHKISHLRGGISMWDGPVACGDVSAGWAAPAAILTRDH